MMRRGFLILSLVSACSYDIRDKLGPPPPDDEYRGHYTRDFSVSAFQVCGGDPQELWWVQLHSKAQHQLRTWPVEGMTGAPWRAFVRWRGHKSPIGSYGQLGMYARVLEVSQILEVRASSPEDCQDTKEE